MPFQEISVPEFEALQKQQEITLIDIRDPESFAAGHIENARHIDNSNIEQFIQETDKEKSLIVCCYHGNSSQGAADFMNQRGFKDTYSLIGGFEAYQSK